MNVYTNMLDHINVQSTYNYREVAVTKYLIPCLLSSNFYTTSKLNQSGDYSSVLFSIKF